MTRTADTAALDTYRATVLAALRANWEGTIGDDIAAKYPNTIKNSFRRGACPHTTAHRLTLRALGVR
jgi:hypothetical protein